MEQDQFEEFKGQPHEDVVAKLKERYPGFDVPAIPLGSMITEEIRFNRIRVWYRKETGLVIGCEKR